MPFAGGVELTGEDGDSGSGAGGNLMELTVALGSVRDTQDADEETIFSILAPTVLIVTELQCQWQ